MSFDDPDVLSGNPAPTSNGYPASGGIWPSAVATPKQAEEGQSLSVFTESVADFVRSVAQVQELLAVVGSPRDTQELRNKL